MDASGDLKILKHIPCPAGSSCTNVRCLFGHAGDENANEVSASVPPRDGVGNHNGATVDLVRDIASPREPSTKRVKTGKEEYDPTAPVVLLSSLEEDASQEDEEVASVDIAKSGPPKPDLSWQAAKPAGVPSLKRKQLPDESQGHPSTPVADRVAARKHSPVNTGISGAFRSTAPATAPAPAPSPTPTPASVAAAVRKAEGLNPRHLKNQPATFQVRWKLVKMLYDQYTRLNKGLEKTAKDDATKKLLLTDQEIIWMALDEEENAAKTNSYSNTLKSRITACKKFTVDKWKAERVELAKKAEAAAALKDSDADAENPSEPVVIETGLTAAQEVWLVKNHLLTPVDDLANFGYVPTVPADEEIAKAKDAQETAQGWEVCDRCTKRFQVFPGRREEDGALASGGKCTHHPGKLYMPNRQSADRSIPERQYRCCGETVGQSVGCTVKDTHVFKHSNPRQLAALWNFVETPENPNAPQDRAVCFDCEMGYTAKGFEMIRFTATSWPDGAELVDVLVRPYGQVLDLNSQYSGVWPEDIANSRPFAVGSEKNDATRAPRKAGERKRLQMVSSPEVARDLLFSLISRDTPLIGHGLENDLNCMRVVHPTIVDTVLLYPHNRGLPIRHGLRMLMQTVLNKRIQLEPAEGQLAGHDSAEDARAAGDLVRWKVKKEWVKMQREGWTLVDGHFVSPSKKVT